MPSWIPSPRQLPVIVLALVVPILLGILLAGPTGGFVVSGLILLGIVIASVRARTTAPIEVAPDPDHPLAIFTMCAIESRETAERVARCADGEGDALLVAPAPTGKLQEWLSDVDPGRREAARILDTSAAALRDAGLDPETRVGEAELEQTIKDTLRNRGARSVAVVGADDSQRRMVAEIEKRTGIPVHQIEV